MGARAFSHDSIFIPDGGAESEQTVQAVSQDNILGKVKTLQVRQLETEGSEPEEPSPPHPPPSSVEGSGRVPGWSLSDGVWGGASGVTSGEKALIS